jgi:hypothetical protein
MLRSILFMLAFLADTTVGQYPCEVCGAAGFAPTLDTKVYVGAQYWYCSEFVSRAADFAPDICSVAQAYALRDCGCHDYNLQPPPSPVVNLSTMCNICGGPNGSDLHAIDPSLANYNVGTGLGDTLTCGVVFQKGLAGDYQDDYVCHTVQESTRAICGCNGPSW